MTPERPGAAPSVLRGRPLPTDRAAVMAIINRTPDSFFDGGATFGEEAALDAVSRGGRRGRGPRGHRRGEGRRRPRGRRRRGDPAGGAVHRRGSRERFPDLVISVDTWRSAVADGGLRGRRRPDQRHLGRRRPGAGRGGRPVRRGHRLLAHRRRRAADQSVPGGLPRRRRRGDRGDDRRRRQDGRRPACPPRGADRPDPRLRQEHLARPGVGATAPANSLPPVGPC